MRIISLLEWPEPENTLNLDAAIQAVSLTLKDANFKTLHYKEQGKRVFRKKMVTYTVSYRWIRTHQILHCQKFGAAIPYG